MQERKNLEEIFGAMIAEAKTAEDKKAVQGYYVMSKEIEQSARKRNKTIDTNQLTKESLSLFLTKMIEEGIDDRNTMYTCFIQTFGMDLYLS